MLEKIRRRINKELAIFAKDIDKVYGLNRISPLLSGKIKNFILRKGKRARPAIFILGFLGFSQKIPAGLYRSAISLELLHDFMLVHDDIIDKSQTRRGGPAMHAMFNGYLEKFKGLKFSGQDLSIAAGDVMFALAIDVFLEVKTNHQRKEKALRKFIQAALFTGAGEFLELTEGTKRLEEINKADIYKIYCYKTAYYTFAAPLSMGAILAGAGQKQVNLISKFGMLLGTAFQIKDDILGIFAEENKTGKSSLTDLQEAKKTLLVWFAYNRALTQDKLKIKKIMSKIKVAKPDLSEIQKIISQSGALELANLEISRLVKEAFGLLALSKMLGRYQTTLEQFSRKLLGQATS